ncbi:SAC3 domain-containing protein 1 [Carettochelys insculpta]|uniref:SAC3 domain-containing protein 1 n=1 Tax=Carettochelys insculpta TaxID=44489 RepID=UPI003EBCAB7B
MSSSPTGTTLIPRSPRPQWRCTLDHPPNRPRKKGPMPLTCPSSETPQTGPEPSSSCLARCGGDQSPPDPHTLSSSAVDAWRRGGSDEFPVGTCPGMCPADELAQRERQGRLHRLELQEGTRQGDPARVVKEYSRPAAGKGLPQPQELRPAPVLLITVRYLLGQVTQRADLPLAEVYAFVSDRLRAVRQDATLQRLQGAPCMALLERSLGYLLHAGYQLCQEPLAHFDPHLHSTQIQECFSWLRRCYRDSCHKREPAFQALFLLYNLGLPEALCQVLQLPDSVRASPELRTALAVNWAYLERDWARFFRLAQALPYLPSCALHRHLGPARRLALLTFSHGFSAKNCRCPLAWLVRLLAVDSPEEMEELCHQHGLPVQDGAVVFQKAAFRDPGVLVHSHSQLLVDSKRGEAPLLGVIEDCCS